MPRVELSASECADEYIMMAMRLREGADLARYEALAGRTLRQDAVARLADLGMLTLSGGRIAATASGRIVLNAILRDIVP